MTSLHPQFITDSAGNKLSAILPIQEYEALLEYLDMEDDIRLYKEAKAAGETPVPINEAFAMLDAKRNAA